MKLILRFSLLVLSAILFAFSNHSSNPTNDVFIKAQEALSFCQENQFNTTFCVLVDMRVHSGKNRIYLWNFETKKIIDKGLCSHGCCDSPWGEDLTKTNPQFSNVPESHCSSLGKYKIGARGWSNWGIHVNYKLHGLESSNNNALPRQIVLHSWVDVAEEETFPEGAPEGWGCPAVSNDFLTRLDTKLKVAKKPVLLWIYNN